MSLNLIQMTKIVKEKEKTRNKLLGQREMLMEGLSKLGFKSTEEAKADLDKKKDALTKMNAHYINGEEKFKTQFEHLLHP